MQNRLNGFAIYVLYGISQVHTSLKIWNFKLVRILDAITESQDVLEEAHEKVTYVSVFCFYVRRIGLNCYCSRISCNGWDNSSRVIRDNNNNNYYDV